VLTAVYCSLAGYTAGLLCGGAEDFPPLRAVKKYSKILVQIFSPIERILNPGICHGA